MDETPSKPIRTDYPSNSKKEQKPEVPEKRVERVVTGEVIQRKKPLGRKIAESFTGEDARSVGNYVLFDVLLPAAKSMISDAISQGIERMLFGDSRPRSGSMRSRTNYNQMSNATYVPRDEPRSMSRRARATHDFDEIVIASRGEAEEVLENLIALTEKYSAATVGDFYDAVGVSGSYTDEKWGWTDLRNARVVRVRNGYIIDLPKTVSLD